MIKIRKSLFYFLIGLIILSFFLNFFFLYQNLKRNTVVKVVDGDSFSLADGRRIRMLGIDAPEKDRCMYMQAKERLKGLIEGKRVILTDLVTDDYGRQLANVWIPNGILNSNLWVLPLAYPKMVLGLRLSTCAPFGMPSLVSPTNKLISSISNCTLINKELISEGLARFVYVKSPYYEVLKQAGQEAKDGQRGIYSKACRTDSPNVDCLIKGNIRDGEQKVYHLPSCPNYDQVIIDESFGDRWFCTETDAQKAGFRKASGCR